MLPAVSDYDVIVVGAGNAALAAAVSAREQGLWQRAASVRVWHITSRGWDTHGRSDRCRRCSCCLSSRRRPQPFLFLLRGALESRGRAGAGVG